MARIWNHNFYWSRTAMSQSQRKGNDSSDSISLRHLVRASSFLECPSISILPAGKILCHKTQTFVMMSTEVVTQMGTGIFQMSSSVIPCNICFCTILIPLRTCHCPMVRSISWSSAGLSGAIPSSDCLPLLPPVVTPTSASFPHFVFLCWGWPCLHVIHQRWSKTGRGMIL